MSKVSDAAQLERLRQLAELPDSRIDTSDLPVIEDWSAGVRGASPRDVRRKAQAATDVSTAPSDLCTKQYAMRHDARGTANTR